MGRIGYGYGSEWHLMRYLGRHRDRFDGAVVKATDAQSVSWLDFPFGDSEAMYLAEHKGLDLLFGETASNSRTGLRRAWEKYWPQSGNSMNWDAVGWLRADTQMELLLVEAKCHEKELESKCGAKERGGRPLILASLDKAKATFGAPLNADWTEPYYQYCNRLAVLHFLHKNSVPARLLFVYFTGDDMGGCTCPDSDDKWGPILGKMYKHIGVPWDKQQDLGVHKVFLPVSGKQ